MKNYKQNKTLEYVENYVKNFYINEKNKNSICKIKLTVKEVLELQESRDVASLSTVNLSRLASGQINKIWFGNCWIECEADNQKLEG